jgi:hypothetical protein
MNKVDVIARLELILALQSLKLYKLAHKASACIDTVFYCNKLPSIYMMILLANSVKKFNVSIYLGKRLGPRDW